MVDGVGSLMTMHYGYWQAGQWDLQRGSNTADGGSPWYTTYRTSDGGYMAVGAVEKRFYAELLSVLGLADADLPDQNDRAGWPRLRTAFAEVFATRTRDEWEAAFDGIDACATPVLDMAEAPAHELAQARGSFLRGNGVIEPAPAPRFSRSTPADVRPRRLRRRPGFPRFGSAASARPDRRSDPPGGGCRPDRRAGGVSGVAMAAPRRKCNDL